MSLSKTQNKTKLPRTFNTDAHKGRKKKQAASYTIDGIRGKKKVKNKKF